MGSTPQVATECRIAPLVEGESWFAIHTRARHEKNVARELTRRNIGTFLPLVNEIHHWSDRRRAVQVPLFSCYAFVSMNPTAANRVAVLRVPGVLGFVSRNHQPAPVSEQEIEGISAVLTTAARFSEYPFLKVGQRVRLRGGALSGLEGLLVSRNGDRGLVISIDAIERSLLVQIQGYDLEHV